MHEDVMAALIGMPSGKKRTRRGRRKGKTPSAHDQHLKTARDCVACGDHKGAKAALFRAANALGVDDGDEGMEEVMEAPAEVAVAQPSKGLSPALVAYLARKK